MRARILAAAAAVAVAVAVAACSSEGGARDSGGAGADAALEDRGAGDLGGDAEVAEDARADAGDGSFPGCHYDCLRSAHECMNGVVTTYVAQPVPCDQWTGSCPHDESYTCMKGCRRDGVAVEGREFELMNPAAACEEGRPKMAGDPCTVEADCDPTPAHDNGDGTVTNTYIHCEVNMCVEDPAPMPPNYLGLCGSDFRDIPVGSYGYVETATAACPGGLCLIAPSNDLSCVMQGCTIACREDSDCPQGAVCEGTAMNQTPGGGTRPVDVCKPGPRLVYGIELHCP